MAEIIGIGTEIVECLRVAQMIERHGEQFINRVYTTAEIEYCRSRRQATQHFAARWAGKEAILKALGLSWQPGMGWRDFELDQRDGRPVICLHGEARAAARERRIARWLVSLAYCRSHATAYVLGLGD